MNYETIRTPIPEITKTVSAIEIDSHTLIGVDRSKFPVKRGNCFSVIADDGERYDVINFYYENLLELCRNTKLTWPIKMGVLAKGTAVFNDHRIHDQWYAKRFCEVCCPDIFLPLPQRLKNWRDEESGKRKMQRCEDGAIITSFKL